MNPRANSPRLAQVAYSLASSKAGGPAALEPLLPVSYIVELSSVDVELAEELEAVEVALCCTGFVAPHVLSDWQAPSQEVPLSQAAMHCWTYSTQVK